MITQSLFSKEERESAGYDHHEPLSASELPEVEAIWRTASHIILL